MAIIATRQDTHRIVLKMENLQTLGKDPAPKDYVDHGVWDKKTGGAVDSDDSKYYPGGMEPPISLGGRRTVDNITLQRLYRIQRDHEHVGRLLNGAGRAQAQIIIHPMDKNHNVHGPAVVYNCTLKRVMLPDLDSESSAAALIELEFTVDGFPTQ